MSLKAFGQAAQAGLLLGTAYVAAGAVCTAGYYGILAVVDKTKAHATKAKAKTETKPLTDIHPLDYGKALKAKLDAATTAARARWEATTDKS